MKKFSILSFVFMLAAFMVACNDEDDQPMILDQSIVDIALETDDVSILVQALQAADLVGALQGPGPFTVFAPTNAAFENLLASNPDWSSLSDIPTDLLTSVLTFHVVEGRIAAATLSEGTMLETLNGEQLTITGVDPVMINNSASVSLSRYRRI
ncbi:fasciclin repeat-containing protein [Nitritalea halalkaliphila LW7]|uniref:Fasciclin repeat-containing protein n=1 Tax=Nitritalea halalkaliphila LW7 TaxID=1189621 RepID=I5C5S2_9BACT|nr:fasciclin domain-containing protein [Nitritalea halalkaliphila]EIM77174.1 fasciclin repeat-containing protein [Nitritalea halalkaliphila LW7]